jgi:hypothetical protein
MPAQQRGRLDEQAPPGWTGQQLRQPSQHRPVSPVDPGSGYLPAEHRDLVTEQQQFHVVGRRAPRQQHQPSQQVAEAQIEQS